ncbi:MAG: ankyrin repeat domain-containing protein [Coxiellaceae bacterium]|nr:ankyrin repeat domain-containing protein [Coxiellaceae bacterium]
MSRQRSAGPPGDEPKECIFEVTIGEPVASICERMKALPPSVSDVKIDEGSLTTLFAQNTTIECIQIQMALCDNNLARSINGNGAVVVPQSETYDADSLKLLTDKQFSDGRCTNGRLGDAMTQSGYVDAAKEGICFGLATMAIKAFLSGQMTRYIDRVHALSSMNPTEIPEFISQLQALILRLQAREKVLAVASASEELAIVQQRLEGLRVFHTDILAFLDGVILTQAPIEHREMFTDKDATVPSLHQADYPVRDMLAPTEIDAIDRECMVGKTTDAFHQQDLVKQLEILARSLGEGVGVDNKFSIGLADEGHEMALHFDAFRQMWIFQDPNYLPGTVFENTETGREALVAEIYRVRRLESTDITFLEGTVFCAAGRESVMSSRFESAKADLAAYRRQHPDSVVIRTQAGKNSEDFLAFVLGHASRADNFEKILAVDRDAHIKILGKGDTLLTLASLYGYADVVDQLLAVGADVDHVNENGDNAIDCAYQNGQKEIVRKLLTRGSDLNKSAFANGMTRLMYACEMKYEEEIDALLVAGVAIDAKNAKSFTAIDYAMKFNTDDVVKKMLLAPAAFNKVITKNGHTAIMIACERGYDDVVDELIAKRVDVNLTGLPGRTALSIALHDKRELFAEKLIIAGANPNTVVSSNGCTALMSACYKGFPGVVELLVERSVDVTATLDDGRSVLDIALAKHEVLGDAVLKQLLLSSTALNKPLISDGSTALMIACDKGYDDVVDTLLGRGVDVDMPRTDGSTALYRACKYGRTDQVRKLLAADADMDKAKVGGDPYPTARLIAERSSRAEIVTLLDAEKQKRNRLYDACEKGDHAKVCAFLLEGDDIHKVQPNGKTAFDIACDLGIPTVVREFLKPGVVIDVNRVRADGSTALMVASAQGNVAVAEMLIIAGANIEAQRHPDRFRPLHIACQRGDPGMVDMLLGNGADRTVKIAAKSCQSLARYKPRGSEIAGLLRTRLADAELRAVRPAAAKTLNRSPRVKALVDRVSLGRGMYSGVTRDQGPPEHRGGRIYGGGRRRR